MWSSADTNAQRASETIRDNRTPAQKAWDQRESAIDAIIAKARGRTYARAGWTRDPVLLERTYDELKDAIREIQALRVEGFREGDPVDGIPTLAPITTKVAKLGGAA